MEPLGHLDGLNDADHCTGRGHLSIRGLGVAYAGTWVIQGVDLDACCGCVTALVGASGCGKSSLLWAASGLLAGVPGATVAGSVLLDGRPLEALATAPLQRRLGVVFQKPVPFPLSIRENLALPLRETGLRSASELEGRVEAALRTVGLWSELSGRLSQSALGLSGGQQQRLCIARALVLNPPVLLLDEPCSALDPISTGVIEDLLRSLQEDRTLLLVTHNLAQARRLAKFTAVFGQEGSCGRLIETGLTSALFREAREPYTRSYLAGQLG